MSTESGSTMDQTIPQWKRDLILRRRAVGRVLPTGSGSVQLTCPSVVAAVRFADYSVSSDFHRRYESEREQTSGYKNMRLTEQVSASDDFAEPCVILDIKEIITKIESGSGRDSKMGEEKSAKKVYNSPLIFDKNSNTHDYVDDNASDSSEEFKYGPGIVSKLKSKYLSLTLRESQGRIRPPLDSLRRAASLENILDAPESEKIGGYKSNYLKNVQPSVNGNTPQRCRGLSRVNKDSMKRARSVEVLTRYDRAQTVNNHSDLGSVKGDETLEKRKIRKRISSSSVEEKELPPPDLVKHTLKLFECSQNQAPVILKRKNQKPASDCAKKPTAGRKQCVKQNGVDKTVKITADSVSDINRKRISEKNKNVSPEKITVNENENSGEKRKGAATFKEKTRETVINKTPPKDILLESENEENIRKNISPPQCGLSLDLTDTAISHVKRTSPGSLTSPKSCEKLLESPEPKRCISPVLVRAPPCILSSELNSPSSPGQQMKQVGVIRPIITNKGVHSNQPKQPGNKPHLTEREIEKNLINKVKSIEQPVTKVIVSLKKSPEECFVGSNEKIKPVETLKKGEYWDKKPNTMVFNFSNRKTVPDYIENDGLILAQRKEKSKLGEPGIIFLGGSTEDSSTDFDPEDLSAEPPLPCDVVFEGDNILINGKSNMQLKPKLRKMKIQFNDEATTLFEYPSEASLLVEEQEEGKEEGKEDVEVPSTGGSSPGLPNPFRMRPHPPPKRKVTRGLEKWLESKHSRSSSGFLLNNRIQVFGSKAIYHWGAVSGCSSLASYTPSKLSLGADFQLGVTKTPPPPPPPSQPGKESEREEGEGTEEEEGDLRPADENTTVSWSAETAADLLF